MKDALAQTNSAVESSDFTSAKASFGDAKQTWYKFGGSVKEQSADTYQAMDQSVKAVNTALNQSEPTSDTLLAELGTLSGELDTVTPCRIASSSSNHQSLNKSSKLRAC